MPRDGSHRLAGVTSSTILTDTLGHGDIASTQFVSNGGNINAHNSQSAEKYTKRQVRAHAQRDIRENRTQTAEVGSHYKKDPQSNKDASSRRNAHQGPNDAVTRISQLAQGNSCAERIPPDSCVLNSRPKTYHNSLNTQRKQPAKHESCKQQYPVQLISEPLNTYITNPCQMNTSQNHREAVTSEDSIKSGLRKYGHRVPDHGHDDAIPEKSLVNNASRYNVSKSVHRPFVKECTEDSLYDSWDDTFPIKVSSVPRQRIVHETRRGYVVATENDNGQHRGRKMYKKKSNRKRYQALPKNGDSSDSENASDTNNSYLHSKKYVARAENTRLDICNEESRNTFGTAHIKYVGKQPLVRRKRRPKGRHQLETIPELSDHSRAVGLSTETKNSNTIEDITRYHIYADDSDVDDPLPDDASLLDAVAYHVKQFLDNAFFCTKRSRYPKSPFPPRSFLAPADALAFRKSESYRTLQLGRHNGHDSYILSAFTEQRNIQRRFGTVCQQNSEEIDADPSVLDNDDHDNGRKRTDADLDNSDEDCTGVDRKFGDFIVNGFRKANKTIDEAFRTRTKQDREFLRTVLIKMVLKARDTNLRSSAAIEKSCDNFNGNNVVCVVSGVMYCNNSDDDVDDDRFVSANEHRSAAPIQSKSYVVRRTNPRRAGAHKVASSMALKMQLKRYKFKRNHFELSALEEIMTPWKQLISEYSVKGPRTVTARRCPENISTRNKTQQRPKHETLADSKGDTICDNTNSKVRCQNQKSRPTSEKL